MIWGVGLPRSGGQTLQEAITILTGRQCWHSIEAHRWDDTIKPEDAGAVEVYAPISWLRKYPGGPHLFIFNRRNLDNWLASCEKVYEQSQRENWNHPIWKYPLSQFPAYYFDWVQRMKKCGEVIYNVDIVANPTWDRLCDILGVEPPGVPFPNKDKTRQKEDVIHLPFGFKDPLNFF